MNFIIIVVLCCVLYVTFIMRSNVDKDFVINTIVRGCARWASASLQDKSPLVAVLHANYAAGYLWALRDVFPDKDIQQYAHIDPIQFQKRITDVQDQATKLMIKVCPQYRSHIDDYLGAIAGEY